ncbi:MAG: polysaccharide deacetylase family protein [Saprospiraceae bacterium]|nr:polysaccharide deacetylase family protein [Saprospiraceae bacterium]MDW8483961.1 polysaccharide deacetylase family protein [Saprospiraceae bacterium]
MYLVKTPYLVQALWPHFLWRVPTREPVLYLTFDDGPIPAVTPWVLDVLKKFCAKATFFCVGENVMRYPDIYRRIVAEGHRTGNHTYNHLDGWKTNTLDYLQNVHRCAQLVHSNLFRPPYGRLSPCQRAYLERYYMIVLWDVLSGDFDRNTDASQCLANILENAEKGSIIVLHDNIKTADKLRVVLPEVLRHFTQQGLRFEGLPQQFKA